MTIFADNITVDLTWNTVSSACGNVSKLERIFSVAEMPTNRPPNSCMPSSAKMIINRKSKTSKLAMERIELSRDATRLLSDFQYLSG